MKDDLGKRMKGNFEQRTRQYLPRRTYTIIRLDGKCFGNFTRGMNRPYDEGLMRVMDETTKFLCEEIQGCKLGYTQSDEISLLLTDFDKITTDAWFDGQVQKMVSVAASMATGKFNQEMLGEIIFSPDIDVADTIFTMASQPLAFFDARVFTIPDPVEVENYFIWRQKDAVRNSLSMHAQSLYSHKELHGKSQADMHDMIHAKGENWNDLPDGFKRGRTFIKVRLYDIETPGGVIDHGTKWTLKTPDFLKEREDLSGWVPKINESLTE
jgi:tRNA(His) guanylyltransferase